MTAQYIDVAAILDGNITAPQTAVGGRRSDGVPLCYASAVNVLLGAPEAGKTLVAGAMAADEMFSSGRVLWIDLDHNGPAAIVTRFREFGVSRDMLIDNSSFRLAVPEDPQEVMQLVADTINWRPSLVIVDSIGELLPMFGANSNDADDYTRVNRQVLTALASTGAGVLAIDHEAKSQSSSNYGATGTAAKKRAIDGALLRVTNTRPFRPGHGGEAVLSIVKDRHGALRQLVDPDREPAVTVFSIETRDGASLARFGMPAVKAPSVSDVEMLQKLTPPPTSVRDVKDRMTWGSTRASKAFRDFQHVPGTPGNVPGTSGDVRVPVFPTPKGGERGTLTGNTETEAA
ncbi:AAA family ATPase [Microbacterium aquimaris]|uniref:AAA family ATPase n=1 Tax=Microbacterium aquimaris TaxID=459816 RepID=A0ABU5N8F4_9MICO|nr:AAA family ATPase [Microbacterium aquimaris]MDZ8162346.1 AAA family ATPase [Microbacterium aquimaris]